MRERERERTEQKGTQITIDKELSPNLNIVTEHMFTTHTHN